MIADLLTPAAQVCAFALGCALIHVARDQADILTRLLSSVAVAMAAMILIVAAMIWAPDAHGNFDEITTYAAIAGQPPETD